MIKHNQHTTFGGDQKSAPPPWGWKANGRRKLVRSVGFVWMDAKREEEFCNQTQEQVGAGLQAGKLFEAGSQSSLLVYQIADVIAKQVVMVCVDL